MRQMRDEATLESKPRVCEISFTTFGRRSVSWKTFFCKTRMVHLSCKWDLQLFNAFDEVRKCETTRDDGLYLINTTHGI